MRLSFYSTILFFILSIVSCNNGEVENLTAERDSLQLVCEKYEDDLKDLDTLISTIALSLDSVYIAEELLYANKDEDISDREQILENFEAFSGVLSRQKQRVAQLEDSLLVTKSSKWNIIIACIRENLENKETEFQTLKEKFESENRVFRSSRNIARQSLPDVTPEKKASDVSAKEHSEKVVETTQTQEAVINECYVRIGTKKELQSAGLLTGGLLSKKKVNYENVDKSLFNLVDIKLFKVIELNSKNPKILTPQSSTSAYHFEKKGEDKTVLHIDNPTAFWSVFNFLIIQL